MRRVALTGGIATGKSHVRIQFEQLGVPTIDADTLARDVVAVGTPGLKAVVSRFGQRVLDDTGALDRRKLGSIVFSDPVARRDLEDIIHPAVRSAIDAWFQSLGENNPGFAVADIPLLFESGHEKDFDAVVVTACAPATQVERVMKRDGLSRDDAERRVAAQWPIEEKVARADYVVRTDGTTDDTDRQIDDIVTKLGIQG